MTSLHLNVAISSAAIYIVGSVLQILTIVGIALKVKDWRRNPGMLLIVSLAISDLMTCLPYIFGCVGAIFGVQLLIPYFNYVIGCLNHLSWATSSLHMLLMSANRFTAIVFPMKFSKWHGPKYTLVYIVVSWALSISYCSIYAFVCSPLIWSHDFVLVVYDTPTGEANCETDFGITATAMIGPTLLYSATVLKLLIYGKQMRAQGGNFGVDMRLCWQFAIILMFYVCLELSWYFVPQFAADHNNLDLFYIICYAIAFDFTFNPVVYLVFNSTIRSSIRQLFARKPEQTSAVFMINVHTSQRDGFHE